MSATQNENKQDNATLESPDEQGTKSEKYHFGKRFKQWRQENNISAYRIAKMTGVHPSFISNIEASRRPMSDSFMRKLASIKEFNISYETLRAWKIQSEYDIVEMKEALKNALNAGEKEVGVDDGGSSSSAASSLTVPLQLIADNRGIHELSSGEKVQTVNWNGINPANKKDLLSIQLKDNTLWPPVPNSAILLVRKADNFQNGKKYLVEFKSSDKTEVKLGELDSNGQHFIPLVPNAPSVSLDEIKAGTVYQVLAYKVDWS